ncbi:MAG TPA: hypothetical protein VM510_15735 [Caulifigura sp.]|nr:hypothetical protein [Caulifigura sp.]
MMELIERAIPVIQHSPETGAILQPGLTPAETPPPVAARTDTSTLDVDASHAGDNTVSTELAVADVYRTLERLRTQQAQLTSGTVLQQYQRQLTFDVDDSRPSTKVLSVQG